MKKALQIHILLFIISCIFILIYSMSGSPLYLRTGVDHNTFSIVGLGITQGKLPYADLFDHKGPLLFYIFALAKWISYSRLGIYTVMVVFMYFTLYLQYAISLMYVSRRKAMYSLILPLIFLAITMDDGTQCEFFELPFIYLSLYLCLKLLKCAYVHLRKQCFWIGVSCGCVFLIRINDAATLIGVPFFMSMVYLLQKKDYSAVKEAIIFFIAGFIVALAPFTIYFLCIGIFEEVWMGIFAFNIHYLSGSENTFGFPFLKLVILTFLALCTLPIFREKKYATELIYVLLPILIASVIGIGNNPFTHYYIILVPVVGLISVFASSRIINAIMLWIFGVSGWNVNIGYTTFTPLQGSLIFVTYQHYKDYKDRDFYNEGFTQFAEMIRQNVPPQDLNNIWNQNLLNFNGLNVYTVNNITPKNALFIPSHRAIYPGREEEKNIIYSKPDWLLIEYSASSMYNPKGADSIYLHDHYCPIDSVVWDNKTITLMKAKK